jgi:hypothetical protein
MTNVLEWTHVYHASDVDALVLSFDRDRAETLAAMNAILARINTHPASEDFAAEVAKCLKVQS